MAWTTFPTLTDGQILTGAHLQLVRDNFAETAAAKASTAGSIFAATGANALAERTPDVGFTSTSQTTTSTSYTDLATVGPAVTVTTGPKALILIHCRLSNSTAGQNSWASWATTGASSLSASDNYAISYDSPVTSSTAYVGIAVLDPNLTPGSNTFTMKFRVSGGTGTFGTRRISVLAF